MKDLKAITFLLLSLVIIALLCACGIQEETAETTEEVQYAGSYRVTFYDGDEVVYRTRVRAGDTVSDIPDIDGIWLDEEGDMVYLATFPIEADTVFYSQERRSITSDRVRFLDTSSYRFFVDRPVTRGEAAEILYMYLTEDDLAMAEVRLGDGFSDLYTTDGYYDAVMAMQALGIMTGYEDGTFRPDRSITRAEFVCALYKLVQGGPLAGEATSFADVDPDGWAYDAIVYGEAQGWLCGYDDGLFYPDIALTRAEAAVLMEGAAGRQPDEDMIDLVCKSTPYVDVPQDYWAYYAIMDAAYTNELLSYIYGDEALPGPGFFHLEDGSMCHVDAETLTLDCYEAGFQTIEDGLYYVAEDGYFIAQYSKGLLELDGSMFYVTEDAGPFLTDASYGYLYFSTDGRYTSGSAIVDSYVDSILSNILYDTSMTRDEKLYAAYLSIRDGGYGYRNYRTGWVRGSTSWTLECAEVMYANKAGTCFYWAAAFLYLARRLGYQAYGVCGGVGSNNKLHAWVMIDWDDGQSYIFDVELEWAYMTNYYNSNYGYMNMYKQPLYATQVIYVFPGQEVSYSNYVYAGSSQSTEDDIVVPDDDDEYEEDEDIEEPEETEAPEETIVPTPTASPTATVAPTPTVTATPTASPAPTATPSPTATATPTPAATEAPTPVPVVTPTPVPVETSGTGEEGQEGE